MEKTEIMLRIRSRKGVARLKITEASTVANLKDKIAQQLGIPPQSQQLSFRNAQNKVVQLDNDGVSLESFKFRNGDMINLQAPETTQDVAAVKKQVKRIDKSRAAVAQALAKPDRPKKIVEDPIDVALHKVDGWVPRTDENGDKKANMSRNGSSIANLPIAPWDILNHAPWKDKLNFLPFHAWFRKFTYGDPKYRLAASSFVKKASASGGHEKLDGMSVFVNGQQYRHVDHVFFEHGDILENFISAWRQTGIQRVGFMYGVYEPASDVPLGVKAVVRAIYEPPQKPVRSNHYKITGWQNDPNEKTIDEIAESLGLVKIGFIWTAVKVDKQRQIIPERDIAENPLRAWELDRMAKLQLKHEQPWIASDNGKFGSKFVSVIAYGTPEGTVDLKAYQVSNQCVDLTREDAIRPSKKEPNKYRIRQSSAEVIYPIILYREKDEYGYDVQRTADPNFPTDFFIIPVRHSFPTNPQPVFLHHKFTVENRLKKQQQLKDVLPLIEKPTGDAFWLALRDFHLLLFLARKINRDLFEALVKGLMEPGVNPDDLKAALISSIRKSMPSQPAPTPQKSSPAASSEPNLTAKQKEVITMLQAMGYSEQQAKQAGWATQYRGVEAAIEFLLST